MSSTSGKTHDASIFGPIHLSDSTNALLNINSILWFFKPGCSIKELDAPLACDTDFTNIMVDIEELNLSHERLDVWVLPLWALSNWSKWALAWLEAYEQLIITEPLKLVNFAIFFWKFKQLVGLSFWFNDVDLVVYDAAQDLTSVPVIDWTPSDIGCLRLYECSVIRSVTLVIRWSEHLIFWAGHEKSFSTPITTSYSLTVLWNARDLSLTLPVEECQTTFLSTNYQHGMCFGPTDIASLIFLWGKLNVLEFSLSHGPNRNYMSFSEDGKRVIVLIPLQAINLWSLIAWELKNWFTLSIHDPDDLVITANGNHLVIRWPGRLTTSISQLIWAIFENFLYLTITNHFNI